MTDEYYHFTVPGEPRGKGRPRFARRGKHIVTFTDDKTVTYENLVALHADKVLRGTRLEGKWAVAIVARHSRPKYMLKVLKRTNVPKYPGGPWYDRKPDVDNVAKAVLDGLKTWLDDKAVCRLLVDQFYTRMLQDYSGAWSEELPGAHVTLMRLGDLVKGDA